MRRWAAGFRGPAAALLAFAVFGTVLAARILFQEVAGIEPVQRGRAVEQLRKLTGELRI
jgi:hypothetical protein